MSNPSTSHFEILDGLRFLCAAWVVMSHFNVPQLHYFLNYFFIDSVSMQMQSFYILLFNGTMAVIAFFIISGFCIHLSHASGRQLKVSTFYLSRALRIGLPMAIAIGMSAFFPNGFKELKMVLWSLFCEIIYYAIYPILLVFFKKFGIISCVLIAYSLALTLVCFPDSAKGYFWTYGILGTAVLGLPIWMLGALLADRVKNYATIILFKHQWTCNFLRLVVLLLCFLNSYLHMHTVITYKYSMLVFSPICSAWLYSELSQEKSSWLLTKLGFLGVGSYSIYLIHKFTIPVLNYIYFPDFGAAQWVIYMIAVGILSVGFFFLIEKPAHLLALFIRKSSKVFATETVVLK